MFLIQMGSQQFARTQLGHHRAGEEACTQCQGIENDTLAGPASSTGHHMPATASAAPDTPALQQHAVPSCSTQRQPTGPSTLPARSAVGTVALPHRRGASQQQLPPPLGMASYLLVQPQELAVTHSAVQYPIHVDVVGLQGETPIRSQHLPDGGALGPAKLRAHGPPQGEAPAGLSPTAAQEEARLLRTLTRGRWGTPSPPLLSAELSPCPGKHRDPLAPSHAPCRAGHCCRSWVCLAGTGPSPEGPIPAACHPPPGPPPGAAPEHTALQCFPCRARALSSSQGQHPQQPGEGQGPHTLRLPMEANACNKQPQAGITTAPSTARTRRGCCQQSRAMH